MKLELKHIAPYLPYDIQGIDKFNNYYYLYSIDSRMGNVDLWMNGNFHKFNGGDGIKPIVRPLSDLTQELTHNDKTFNPIQELRNISSHIEVYECSINGIEIQKDTNDIYCSFTDLFDGYLITQKLFEWHFDVFGLIEKGLAIDFNTIKE